MLKLFCDITRQRFVQGFRIAAEQSVFLTQNDAVQVEVYLVVPNPKGGRFPLMYDASSGKDGVTATATVCNPGGTPLTLTDPVELTGIQHGFTGTLRLDTEEIETFLGGRAERSAFLAIELAEGDETRSVFYGDLIVRKASTAAGTVRIPSVIRKPLVTGYTGGGETKLDGLTTETLAIGTIFWVKINGAESHWEYTGPGDTPSDPDSGIILTADGGQLVRTLGL